MSSDEVQQILFDAMIEELGEEKRTIAERFWEFHHDNPEVYAGLKALALALRRTGQKRYGIAGLYEALRYDATIKGGTPFKLNDHYKPLYARLLMSSEPELEGFFEIRKRRTD